MTDEIDLLRRFRDDTPGPDDAAWERARTAIAGTRASGPDGARYQSRRRWRPSRRFTVITAVTAVAAVTAAVLVGVLQGPPTLTRPLRTSWQAARPLPASGHGVQAPAGTWRLMSYLVSQGWQENTAGPEDGVLNCPTASTCYVEGDNATSSTGPADMNSLYVSADGGSTWSVLPVPAGVTFTSALSCANSADCAAGGLYYGHQPVYLVTANGGHSWTVTPLPASVGQVFQLDCTLTSCRGLGSGVGQYSNQATFSDMEADARFVTVTAGGHFTARAFPAGASVQDISCPTAAECVAVGADGKNMADPLVLFSRNGGASWHRGNVHGPFGLTAFPAVTCADATDCAMLGYVMGTGTVTEKLGGGVSETGPAQYSVVAFSADGGATWTSRTFPRAIPYPNINDLACPTADTCYAAGGDLIPQQIGKTFNAESAVVAVTRDAGRTWQRITFQVPAKVPGGMQGDSFMSIGEIQCPQPDACVALGISDQGSTSTPVYTNHGALSPLRQANRTPCRQQATQHSTFTPVYTNHGCLSPLRRTSQTRRRHRATTCVMRMTCVSRKLLLWWSHERFRLAPSAGKGRSLMLFLVNRRYPRLGAVLSVLSSVAFVALGVAEHSMFMMVSSAVFLALPLVKAARKHQAGAPQERP
jgi:photosystem II stability/assembly factor-like uncharacterized protein